MLQRLCNKNNLSQFQCEGKHKQVKCAVKKNIWEDVMGRPVVFTSCFSGRSLPAELPVSSIFSVLTVFIKAWYKHISMALETLLCVLLIWEWKKTDSWFRYTPAYAQKYTSLLSQFPVVSAQDLHGFDVDKVVVFNSASCQKDEHEHHHSHYIQKEGQEVHDLKKQNPVFTEQTNN